MNSIEQILMLIDRHGVSLVILGIIIFLAIKYTPKIVESYREYVKTMTKFNSDINKLGQSMKELSDDMASLDISVSELQETMKQVGVSVNHNSDRLLEIVKEVSFIKGKLNGKGNK